MTTAVGFHLRKVPRVVKFIETESGPVVARGWGLGRNGALAFSGTDVQSEKMEEYQRWKVVTVAKLQTWGPVLRCRGLSYCQ